MVAVATGGEGYTTLAGIVPAIAFHALVSAAGMEALTAAARRQDAAQPKAPAVVAEEGVPAV
jgi:hypothetical protein